MLLNCYIEVEKCTNFASFYSGLDLREWREKKTLIFSSFDVHFDFFCLFHKPLRRIRISIYQNRLIAHINLRNVIIGELCIGGNEKTPLKKRGRNCYIICLPAQHSGSISTDSSYRFSAKDRTFTTFATENLAGVKSTYLKSAVLHSGQTICLFLGALSSFTVDLCFLNLCLYRQFLLLNITFWTLEVSWGVWSSHGWWCWRWRRCFRCRRYLWGIRGIESICWWKWIFLGLASCGLGRWYCQTAIGGRWQRLLWWLSFGIFRQFRGLLCYRILCFTGHVAQAFVW